MKNRINAIKYTGILLLAAGLILTGAGIYIQYDDSKSGYTGNTVTQTVEFEEPKELVIITNDLPITVRYGDTPTVKVSYSGGLPLIFSEDKGTLRITQDDKFSVKLFSLTSLDFNVTVTLPHRVYKRIRLAASSGSVQAYSLGADSIEVSTKSGDITLYNADERTDIRTDSGSVTAYLSSVNADMTVNSGDGDIRLYVPGDMLFGLQYYTESGSFSSDHFEENYYKKFGDAVILGGWAKKVLTVNTAGGDLEIYNNPPLS